jgi:hypothetical protein
MLQKEHDKFLELVVKYYNCREDWISNNTRVAGIAYRKTLKEFIAVCKDMINGIQEVQHIKRLENKRIYDEKGFVPRKSKPKERPQKPIED